MLCKMGAPPKRRVGQRFLFSIKELRTPACLRATPGSLVSLQTGLQLPSEGCDAWALPADRASLGARRDPRHRSDPEEGTTSGIRAARGVYAGLGETRQQLTASHEQCTLVALLTCDVARKRLLTGR
jgi:hypothetical protein